ncbi:MAG: 50S ribosomal protein L17 [Firmicutes bacterium ADurb.Bin193]|nr:MAG: 50S ribosomal protein L17 [Firmicutes bacterium ADurb.Bin193]
MAINRKLSKPTDQRIAMLRGQTTALLEHGKIETTVTRAKELRSTAEKMITLGKTNTLHTYRLAMQYITKEDVVKKLFDEIAPKYSERNGGYTRIIKTGPRRGDAAEMAIIELV